MSETITHLYFEKILLKYLFNDLDVREKILPFLTIDIFDDFNVRENINTLLKFVEDRNSFPSVPEMKLELKDQKDYEVLMESLEIDISEYDRSYMLDKLEDFFKRKMILNELTDAVSKLKEENINNLVDTPDKIRDKLSFSFDTEVGLNGFSDKGAKRFFDHLHKKETVISCGIPYVDKIIDGGFHEKSLNLFMAGTGGFKSGVMCSTAVNNLIDNKKVLYVTLEMSEEKIFERILANTLDVDIGNLKIMSENVFMNKMKNMASKFFDKLYIKEYPAKTFNSNRLRNLLKELKTKCNFIPDIIFVDYLGLMITNNIKNNSNSYEELKRVSEELRGVASEYGPPIVSAVQTNRGGITASVLDLTDMADSIGIAATADLIIGIIQNEEYAAAGKLMWMLLKNRYGINGMVVNVAVCKEKMRVYPDDGYVDEAPKKTTTLVDDAAVEVISGLRNEKKKSFADFAGIEM
jgi:replicative DNA helicase